jgi:hypothetical protein
LRTRLFNALIADSSSLSPPGSRNSTHLVVSRTSRNAVLIAAEPGKPNVLAKVATTGHRGKCTPSYALSVALRQKYRSNLVATDPFTAVIATLNSEQADNTALN